MVRPVRYHLVEKLNRVSTQNDIVQAILNAGVTLLGGQSASVHLLEETGSELSLMGSVGVPPWQVPMLRRFAVDAALPPNDAMRTGEPVVVRNEALRRERYPLLDESHDWPPSFLVVPMHRTTGEPFGVLSLGFPSEERLDDLDDRFLAEVVGHSALALDRAQHAQVAATNQEQFAFLDGLAGALSRTLDLDTALVHLTELAAGARYGSWSRQPSATQQ